MDRLLIHAIMSAQPIHQRQHHRSLQQSRYCLQKHYFPRPNSRSAHRMIYIELRATKQRARGRNSLHSIPGRRYFNPKTSISAHRNSHFNRFRRSKRICRLRCNSKHVSTIQCLIQSNAIYNIYNAVSSISINVVVHTGKYHGSEFYKRHSVVCSN